STLYSHWARLIEILHCAEEIKILLDDDEIMGDDLVRKGIPRLKGIGIIEAPRGTLTHHYEVDEKGMITRCNLIVSTTNNNDALNTAVRWVANNVISRKGTINDAMLNQVEVAIRAYDPCLSCATQALGKMSLKLEIYNNEGELIDERCKD
ncbi:MAG: nickel-dependent hydrogenase large subunit, partial [Chitinophagales bacterium]